MLWFLATIHCEKKNSVDWIEEDYELLSSWLREDILDEEN